MLGSIRSSFRRKNSNRSTASNESQGQSPKDGSDQRRSSFRGPVDLAADVESLRIGVARGGNSPTSPVSARSEEPSLRAGMAPATRRPGESSFTLSPDMMAILILIPAPDRPGMNAFTVPSNEPPPAYTENPTAASGPTLGPSPTYTPPATPSLIPAPLNLNSRAASPTPSATSSTGQPEQEDPYAFLTHFDTILLIDDSGSMAGRSWRETTQALSHLLPVIVSHDADGIDIFFLNHISPDPGDAPHGIASGGYRNVRTVEEVTRIFKTVKPSGGTPTGTRCRAILRPYLAYLERQVAAGKSTDDVKPLNIITITDGVPSDDVEAVLLQAAKKLDALDAAPHQIGVQFFQVGNEEGAAEALMELDDGIADLVQGGVRDMVDTCTWMGGPAQERANGETEGPRLTAEGMLKVTLGAVVRRLDRRRCSAEMAR